MPITIDVESGRLSRQSVDIDNMRERFKTSNDIYTFPSPSLYTIEKNIFYLLRNSKEVDFDSKYLMKPEYLSYDEYGTSSLWQLLMYVNSVFCKEEFNLSTVLIPSFTSIITITQDNYSMKNSSDLERVEW
jgi:hypothetical protein